MQLILQEQLHFIHNKMYDRLKNKLQKVNIIFIEGGDNQLTVNFVCSLNPNGRHHILKIRI